MELTLIELTQQLVVLIEAGAGILIVLVAIRAFAQSVQAYFLSKGPQEVEDIRLHLGRWLVLALEFEMAADILRTATNPSWMELGRLAAVAMIRTALNYMLELDDARAASRQRV